MRLISKFLRFMLKAMVAEFNGIQVFIDPITIFYWLSSTGILWAFTSLVSFRTHLLPLSFLGIILIYVCFMVLKIYTYLFPGPHNEYPKHMSEFYDSIIHLHLVLFVTIIILMIFYVLTKFLEYFYAIELPFKQGVMFLFRAYTILLIVYYYLRGQWLRPLRLRMYSKKRSELICHIWIYAHPWQAFKFSALNIILIFIAVRAYVFIITYILSPLLSYLSLISGLKLNIELLPVNGIGSIGYNIFMLSAAFMLSNLFFYPFVYIVQRIVNPLHPMKIKQVKSAQI